MVLRRIFQVAALTLVFALIAPAQQTGSGRVQGVVKDSSGAAIPGATVTIANTATAVQNATNTNDVGLFFFPPVVPGNYTLTAQSPGMETWKGSFLLQVGQTAEISPVMKVGAVTTQVTVAGEVAPLVATADATISTDLEHARIEQLPEDGRSIANTVLLATPGLSVGDDGSVNPIINGLRDSVELYQDGQVIKNRDTGDWSGRLPGVDSVGELQVETSLLSAKSDRPGAVILSTKSGTNGIHGSLFETNRNSGVGVARRRQDYYTKPPAFVRNEFGGSVGGPVYIPKVYNGKNRTFFFTTLELLRVASEATASVELPTMVMRQGDFSGLTDSLGRLTVLYDPLTTGPAPTWTRTPFPNNQIPVGRESPVAKYLYGVTPAPTNTANPLLANNYFGLEPSPTHDNMSTTRIDENLSAHNQLFIRVTRDEDQAEYPKAAVPTTDGLLNMVYNLYRDSGAALSWTHSFSPTFLSETLVTFSRENKVTGNPSVGSLGMDMADYLGMPNPTENQYLAYKSTEGFSLGYQQQRLRQNFTNIFVIDQNFTRIHGRHEIEFGARFHYEEDNVLVDQPIDQASYGTGYTALFDPTSGSSYANVTRTGYAAASFFLGASDQYQETAVKPFNHLREGEYGGYVQDNWKATPRLTLNLGLRYEDLPPITEANNFMASFDRNTDSIVLGRSPADMYAANEASPAGIAQYQAIGVKFETPQQAGLPASLVYGNAWNFEPRIGFAYRVGQAERPLVLRGGYGIYYSQTALRAWDGSEGFDVPFGASYTYNVNNQTIAGFGDGLPNYEARSVPQYVDGVNSSTALNNPALVGVSRGQSFEYNDPHQPPSRSYEWNFSLGRELVRGIVATATYTGTHAMHLPQVYDFNAAPNDYIWYTTTGLAKPTGTYASTGERPYDTTTYSDISDFQSTGMSNTNSLQLDVEHRYSRGYAFQFYYVMTNSFNDSTLVANGGGPTITPASTYLPGAVPQDFNQLDRFLNYTRSTDIPHHQLRWNWVADLPFGRGKLLGRNANRALDAVIGGWQIAGTGSYQSRYWSLPTSNYGPMSQPQMYGVKEFPIRNCTSGVSTCIPGYLDWNGYISPPTINRTDTSGNCTGICGIPSTYTPSNLPLITYGQTALPANAPSNTVLSTYWETQTVWIALKNGTVTRTTINTNLPAWQNQYVAAPWTFGLNASLFKVFNVTESVKLRFNADFFQVLNNPGLGTPGSNGILSTQNSNNSPRDLQLTLRLTW
ncbi:MAG: TonB-dependent receptor [Bryobacteraceae bacterium]|jgi:hypothetical protein